MDQYQRSPYFPSAQFPFSPAVHPVSWSSSPFLGGLACVHVSLLHYQPFFHPSPGNSWQKTSVSHVCFSIWQEFQKGEGVLHQLSLPVNSSIVSVPQELANPWLHCIPMGVDVWYLYIMNNSHEYMYLYSKSAVLLIVQTTLILTTYCITHTGSCACTRVGQKQFYTCSLSTCWLD